MIPPLHARGKSVEENSHLFGASIEHSSFSSYIAHLEIFFLTLIPAIHLGAQPNPSKSHVNGLEPSTYAARSLVRVKDPRPDLTL